jgi:phosphohistidine phosphatase SixA
MRKLIIVRHGEADGKYLTEHGCATLVILREKLKPHLADMQVRVFSSTAMRAMRSAYKLFGGTPIMPRQGSPELLSDDSETHDLEMILALVDSVSSHCDVAILVTHLEITRDFPSYFAARRLHCSGWGCKPLRRAEAYVIDCEDNTCLWVGS